MDDRKYRQRGYQDTGNGNGNGHSGDSRREKPRNFGPKPPIDITGPRLPRMVQSVTASRCWNCSVTLPVDTDFKGTCPKCSSPLHCCKQCSHFEPSTRFQCLKAIPVRVAYKDQTNECAFYSPRVTVARDAQRASQQLPTATPTQQMAIAPRTPQDARAMFDQLFKK